MRYSPSDKTEIIRLVEQSLLPPRRTLDKLGIPRSSFYRWYDRYQRGGPEARDAAGVHARARCAAPTKH
jgi:transposase-like protein